MLIVVQPAGNQVGTIRYNSGTIRILVTVRYLKVQFAAIYLRHPHASFSAQEQ